MKIRCLLSLLFLPIALYAGHLLTAQEVGTPTAPDLRLFLLIGQSNMAGRGVVEAQDQVTHPRIFMLDKSGAWQAARDPLHFDKPTIAGVGLASEFARCVVAQDPNVRVGLVPCAFGGSSLKEWQLGSTHYTNTVARMRQAMHSGQLAAILWHQGESDTREELRTTYATRFAAMIAQLRQDLKAESVPVLVGELGHYNSIYLPFNELLPQVTNQVPNCRLVSAQGLAPKADNVHFDSVALREFGRRFFAAYEATRLRVATFRCDVTPEIGAPLCNGLVPPASEIITPLEARGVVISGAGKPIVLCAVDWVGIGEESHLAFREAIAQAADTDPERVAVHTLHQHDTPGSAFATEELLAQHGLAGVMSDANADRRAIAKIAQAVAAALTTAQPVTHLGLGSGKVEKVASNRNVPDAEGKTIAPRFSACRNQQLIDAPEGLIDPIVRLVTFWNDQTPIAALTYYATHPQSYYGKGGVNWEFVGMAREMRDQAVPNLTHVHFCGACGNVAAGKYNDGSPAMRPILAERLAAGMRLAWEGQTKVPLTATDVAWKVMPTTLPPRRPEQVAEFAKTLADTTLPPMTRVKAARELIFTRRMLAGKTTPLTALRLGQAWVLHLPGELFIEYQLAAQALRPNNFVAVAAYGDYNAGYIPNAAAFSYGKGCYEAQEGIARVAPAVEEQLLDVIKQLLER